jgi:hypothetical protein
MKKVSPKGKILRKVPTFGRIWMLSQKDAFSACKTRYFAVFCDKKSGKSVIFFAYSLDSPE